MKIQWAGWGEWKASDLPLNGILFAGGCDSQLGDDSWGVFLLTLTHGLVVSAQQLTHDGATAYNVGPSLVGMTRENLIKWARYEEHTSGMEYINRLGILVGSDYSYGREEEFVNITWHKGEMDHDTTYNINGQKNKPKVVDNGDGTGSFAPGVKLTGMGF